VVTFRNIINIYVTTDDKFCLRFIKIINNVFNSFMNSPKSPVGTRYLANTCMFKNLDPSCTAHPISCSLVMHCIYWIKIWVLFDEDAHFSFARFLRLWFRSTYMNMALQHYCGYNILNRMKCRIAPKCTTRCTPIINRLKTFNQLES
jgi:hypothetical protein